jgi:hypothetical protein
MLHCSIRIQSGRRIRHYRHRALQQNEGRAAEAIRTKEPVPVNSRLSRFDASDIGYAAHAIKPFEDLSAHELARRVRAERAAAIGDALATLISATVRLPARLLGRLRGPRAPGRVSASR